MITKWRYRVSIIKRIVPFAKPIKLKYFMLFIISILEMLLALALPFLFGIFMDEVIMNSKLKLLGIVIGGYISIQIGYNFIAVGKNYFRNEVANKVSVKIKEKIIDNYLNKPFDKLNVLEASNTKMILDEDMVKLDAFVDTQTIDYTIAGVKLVIILFLLFWIEWKLSLLAILIIPITYFFDYQSAKRAKQVNDEQRDNYSKWTSWLHQTISSWREVRALNLEEYEEKEFKKYCEINAKYFTLKTRWLVTRTMVLPKIKDEFFMQFSLYFVGGILIYFGYITIGALLVFTQYYLMFSQALQTVSATDADLVENMNFYSRVLGAVEDETDKSALYNKTPENFDIDFDNVTFRYPDGERDVISNFNLHVGSGERIGIVGESGKGKTTLLKLMVGMYHPQKGVVRFSNRDLLQWNMKKVYERVGIVMQENMLYNTTIRENLLYGKDDATQEELEVACQKAHILDFIMKLSDQFDTIIGERGIKLSGGQKQRVVLARLFLRNVDVFILDEATSALDQHAENMVQQAINGIDKSKTIIVVSHRESSLRLCNKIIKI